jgi:hypothetical protein
MSITFNKLGQWSLQKSIKEPDSYQLKNGSTLHRSWRGQTASDGPNTYVDEWKLHDPEGKHLGFVNVTHGPNEPATIDHGPFSFAGTSDDPASLKMKSDGLSADEDSFNEHVKAMDKHMPHAIGALAGHYGNMALDLTGNEGYVNHGHLSNDAKKANPDLKHFNTKQTVAELKNWEKRPHHASFQSKDWHHIFTGTSGKVNYHALGQDPESSTGGLYSGGEGGIKADKKPDKGSMN